MKIKTDKILSLDEIRSILVKLHLKKTKTARLNLIIFRLSACCGLRISEIASLKMGDCILSKTKPHLIVCGKGQVTRHVPLWWDSGTLADIMAWKDFRRSQGATDASALVSLNGKSTNRANLHYKFKTIYRLLGDPERAKTLTSHCGRHSFASHSLASGRTLAEVRDALGHSNISTTSVYLHIANDDGEITNIFGE